VAPLVPSLSVEFHASTDLLGMLVPAYMLSYGISTLWPLCVLTLLRAIHGALGRLDAQRPGVVAGAVGGLLERFRDGEGGAAGCVEGPGDGCG
jgi:hypothetical protein